MKWKEHLKRQLPSNGRWENYEQLYRMCLLAYAEGCNEEKKKLSRHTGFVVADCLETGACRLPAAGRIKKRYVIADCFLHKEV